MSQRWRSKRLILLTATSVAAVASGLGIAWAATTATTGTNVSCATATIPARTGSDANLAYTESGTSTSACNTVTYTVPTVTQTVTATPTSSTSSTATTTSTTTSSTTSSPPTGAVVAAAPTGPATPTGGWAVQYADAFGSCLTDTGTGCSAGYARSDNTLSPATRANGAGNANEIAALEPSAVNVTAQGIDLHCSATANLGDSYTCGAVTGGAYGSNPPGAFHWTPAAGVHLVIQAVFQAPANQGNMDPSFWVNGPSDNPEVDIPEMWGMNHVPPAGAANTWCGFQLGDPAVPFDSGGATGNVQATFCGTGSGDPQIDPSKGTHTWTFDENGNTFTSYVDGHLIGANAYSNFNSTKGLFKMLLMASMREDPPSGGPRSGYPFPPGGNDLTFRSVAVYEPASANGAGTNGPIIVPGTSVQ
jgi:hypothetical protein